MGGNGSRKPRQVSFIIEEKKKPAEPAPIRKATPRARNGSPRFRKKREPIDLTKNPLLNQKVEDAKPPNPPDADGTPVRRVYGLRKVYSTGLGEGGAAADAVIGKLGNTLAHRHRYVYGRISRS